MAQTSFRNPCLRQASSCTSGFFFNDSAPTEIYTLSLHDALPICDPPPAGLELRAWESLLYSLWRRSRSEEHTSELQSPVHLVCRLLLEKKKRTGAAQSPPEENRGGLGAGRAREAGRGDVRLSTAR